MATATEAEEATPETSGVTMESQFYNFARYGEEGADGKTITLTKSDKWLKQAKILDGKNVTLTDTGFCYSKFKAYAINYDDYMTYLEDVAQYKELDLEEIKNKLLLCGLPGASEKQDDKKRRR